MLEKADVNGVCMNIGQAAKASGISSKMIRYYETIGLLPSVARNVAGYRQYTVTEVQLLRFIRRSRDLGFSLDRIRTLIGLWQDTTRKSGDVKQLAQQYMHELDDDIAKLISIREQLRVLAEGCHGDNRPDCPILSDLAS